jgi:hypothetical protein
MNKIYRFILFLILFLFLSAFISENVYSQAPRKILFEGFTNCCCGPCATYGPIMDAFIASHPSDIITVKYHTRGPGPDPMHWADSAQIRFRYTQYYLIQYVPTCKVDGILQANSPYTTQTFTDYYVQRIAVTTPMSVNVTDVRIPGDSIRTTVVLNLSSNLPTGNYKLRVMAIEGLVHYSSPPGTNGETDFGWVYRKSFPDINGISIPTTAGTFTYIYTYKRLPIWVDTSIYTVAFVQNEANQELINSGKSSNSPLGITGQNSNIPEKYSLHQNYPNPFNPETTISFDVPKSGKVTLKIYDILGNLVYSLVDGYLNAGNYKYEFSGADISSGTYFFKLTAGNFTDTKKMLIIK